MAIKKPMDEAARERQRVANARSYAKHRAKRLAAQREYQKLHPEVGQKASAKWRKLHPAEVTEQNHRAHTSRTYSATQWLRKLSVVSQYRKNNREKYSVYSQNRRIAKRNLGGSLSPNLKVALMELQDAQCIYCLADLRVVGIHMDHIMPLALGGAHEDSNIQLLCPTCNCRKNAKHPDTFRKECQI